METNALIKLEEQGQSVWLDYIRRDFIVGGELGNLIQVDGLRGMTSNPAIFEKVILEGLVYDDLIRNMSSEGKNPETIYETITQEDVRLAADEFLSVYENTGGVDGYVSLEVNPHLAHDAKGTIEEARRLWTALNRKNVMIKIPATEEGLPAIRQLISEGININVTLIFGVTRYLQVAEEYIRGIQDRIARKMPVENVASVASFFLSRIDTMVDPVLEQIVNENGEQAELAQEAYGQTAIACAKLAYQNYKRLFESEPFLELMQNGARVQRLLWASTGAKNPKFSKLKYVEPLIGKNTVSTLPRETFEAYREHGDPKTSLENEVLKAEKVLKSLPALGVDLDEMGLRLETEGVLKFIKPFDKLMLTLEKYPV